MRLTLPRVQRVRSAVLCSAARYGPSPVAMGKNKGKPQQGAAAQPPAPAQQAKPSKRQQQPQPEHTVVQNNAQTMVHYSSYIQARNRCDQAGGFPAHKPPRASAMGPVCVVGVYVQVLATDIAHSSPSVMLFFDKQRYLFNAGEGIQRLFREHRLKIQKVGASPPSNRSGPCVARSATQPARMLLPNRAGGPLLRDEGHNGDARGPAR